jgi:hypothetical protein
MVEGNLATYVGSIGEGGKLFQTVANMMTPAKGLKAAFQESNVSHYGDEMLDLVHKELVDSRVPYSTSVEHSRRLNEGMSGKIKDKVLFLQKYTETMNRYQAGMASAIATMQLKPYEDVAQLMSKEQYVKDVVLNAANFTYATQGNFDFMWRTGVEKYMLKKIPFGDTMLTFKAPLINQVALYGNTLKRAMGAAKEDKVLAARLVTALIAVPLFGGIAAIPGVTDLANLADIIGSKEDRDTINSALATVENKIGELCKDITGSTRMADLIQNSFRGGILSGITDVNLSQDTGIAGAVTPFIAQKLVQLFVDVAGYTHSEDYVNDMFKLLAKQAPAINNIYNAGKQYASGYKLDSKGNPLSDSYSAGTAVKEGLFGKAYSDIKASQDIFKGDDELTVQGLHKTLVDLRSYTGIRFASSAVADRKIKEQITNSLRDPEAIREEVETVKKDMNIKEAVDNSKQQLKEWVSSNPIKAARIAGRWLNDEELQYAGKNRDLEKMVRAMQNKVTTYYKANVMSNVIENMTGKKGKLNSDKNLVEYNGRVVKLSSIPFEDRGFYYAVGTAKEVKKKEDTYAEDEE